MFKCKYVWNTVITDGGFHPYKWQNVGKFKLRVGKFFWAHIPTFFPKNVGINI